VYTVSCLRCWTATGHQPSDLPPRTQGDNTALHWAAMRGHVEIVKALLEGGADAGISNRQGRLPLDLCQPTWSHSWRFTREVLLAAA
jgi:ankyrin repeat protein